MPVSYWISIISQLSVVYPNKKGFLVIRSLSHIYKKTDIIWNKLTTVKWQKWLKQRKVHRIISPNHIFLSVCVCTCVCNIYIHTHICVYIYMCIYLLIFFDHILIRCKIYRHSISLCWFLCVYIYKCIYIIPITHEQTFVYKHTYTYMLVYKLNTSFMIQVSRNHAIFVC